jgi:cytoskeletal protein RodZ
MSAKNIFEEYSLEEISKKTKISPISLRFIKNKEYDKIPRVKFLGFIKILQREFKTDLSHLIAEYDEFNNFTPANEPIIKEPIEKKEKKPYLLISLGILILIIAAFILISFKKNTTPPPPPPPTPITKIKQKPIIVAKETNETNKTNETNNTKKENNITALAKKIIPEENITKPEIKQEKPKTYEVKIVPLKKVWFKAINLKTKKTRQYIISKPKTLPKGNYYIKFGHGMVKIEYANTTISPNTKKITQIVLKNGKYEYVNKPPRN